MRLRIGDQILNSLHNHFIVLIFGVAQVHYDHAVLNIMIIEIEMLFQNIVRLHDSEQIQCVMRLRHHSDNNIRCAVICLLGRDRICIVCSICMQLVISPRLVESFCSTSSSSFYRHRYGNYKNIENTNIIFRSYVDNIILQEHGISDPPGSTRFSVEIFLPLLCGWQKQFINVVMLCFILVTGYRFGEFLVLDTISCTLI